MTGVVGIVLRDGAAAASRCVEIDWAGENATTDLLLQHRSANIITVTDGFVGGMVLRRFCLFITPAPAPGIRIGWNGRT